MGVNYQIIAIVFAVGHTSLFVCCHNHGENVGHVLSFQDSYCLVLRMIYMLHAALTLATG